MINLSKTEILNTNFFYLIILSVFSFLINFYYSSLGSFPIDTFLHYDSASRILKGELPVRDYWIVSGLVVDFIQSLFFKIFGINWFAYILHSSLFNLIISLFIYYFFLSLSLPKHKAFFFSISFATLSYTISGTPFVDLHATYFLLLSTLLIFNNINTKKNYIWFIIVGLFFLSFLSKQVPAAYTLIFYCFILLSYFLKIKNYKIIFFIILSFFIFVIFVSVFLKYNEINLKLFYIQYLSYPRSIGSLRFFEISLEDFINKFKFILFPLFLLTYTHINKNRLSFYTEDTIKWIIILTFTIVLLFHQIMTKNQIYVYFLIPLLFAFLDKEIISSNLKYKKYISIASILLLFFVTLKYHIRFNENRKFHELSSNELNKTVDAAIINKNLNGLKWINPSYNSNPLNETFILAKAQAKLDTNFSSEIMLITHYLFLDSVTKKKLNYPNRVFTIDGTGMPLLGNEYYNIYKEYLLSKIKKNKIKEILFFKHENLPQTIISNYIKQECYKIDEDEIFYILKLKCLN